MFCTNCGLDNTATADFCIQCGQQMAGGDAVAPEQEGPLQRFGAYVRQLLGGKDASLPS